MKFCGTLAYAWTDDVPRPRKRIFGIFSCEYKLCACVFESCTTSVRQYIWDKLVGENGLCACVLEIEVPQ